MLKIIDSETAVLPGRKSNRKEPLAFFWQNGQCCHFFSFLGGVETLVPASDRTKRARFKTLEPLCCHRNVSVFVAE